MTWIDILHSDIQGFEGEMLDGAGRVLADHIVKYVFISTHSESLHLSILERLQSFGYRIEAAAGFETHTTSFDGLVFASSPAEKPVFDRFNPLGRVAICQASPTELVRYLSDIW
jgi:hypothetical protein